MLTCSSQVRQVFLLFSIIPVTALFYHVFLITLDISNSGNVVIKIFHDKSADRAVAVGFCIVLCVIVAKATSTL